MAEGLAVLLAARLVVGWAYSLSVPAWESTDEDGHFAYARYLAVHRTLPQPGDPEAETIREKFQPPLYYLLLAPVIALSGAGPAFDEPERNPYLFNGSAGYNFALHRPGASTEPHGAALLAARLATGLISLSGVLAVYLTARRLWPSEPRAAWSATTLYAFWPQLLFIGSMVTNDALVTALAAVYFYLAVRLALDGWHFGRALGLSAVLGAALLTKLNAVGLIPAGGLAMLLSLRAPRQRWLALAPPTLVALGAAWLLSTQDFITAQVLQAQTVAEFARQAGPGGLAHPSFVLLVLQYNLRSFLASFGWGNLEAAAWLYWAWALAANLAAVGLSVALVNRDAGLPRSLLALGALQLAGPAALTLALSIAHRLLLPGRYWLPGLPALAILLVAGWRGLLPQRRRLWAWKALSLGFVITGWGILTFTLLPAYARPQPLASLSAIDHRFDYTFGEHIQLLGHARLSEATPGRDLRLSLCWQTRSPVPENYTIALKITGPDGWTYGELLTYPGRGNYPTSFWYIGVPFCDKYLLPLRPTPSAFPPTDLRLALFADDPARSLPVRNAAGEYFGYELVIPLPTPATLGNLP